MSAINLILTSFIAACFVITGMISLIQPERILNYLGCESFSRNGKNEVRAVYGGLRIGIGLLLLATVSMPGIRTGIFLTVGIVLLGTILGRVISVLLDGSPTTPTWIITALESFQSGILVFVLNSTH